MSRDRHAAGAALAVLDRLTRLPQTLLIGLVRGYRLLLKPWLGNACRFEPTCSAYALEALQRHGAARGAALAGWRVLRCHPWCDGGIDPVPPHRAPADHAGAGLFTRLVVGAPAGPRSVAPPAGPPGPVPGPVSGTASDRSPGSPPSR